MNTTDLALEETSMRDRYNDHARVDFLDNYERMKDRISSLEAQVRRLEQALLDISALFKGIYK
jgi:hypothetical protein